MVVYKHGYVQLNTSTIRENVLRAGTILPILEHG